MYSQNQLGLFVFCLVKFNNIVFQMFFGYELEYHMYIYMYHMYIYT